MTAATLTQAMPGWAYHHAAALLGAAATLICADIVAQIRRADRGMQPAPTVPAESSPLLEWLAQWGRSWESAAPTGAVPPPPPINFDAYTDDQLFTPATEITPVPVKRPSWLRSHTLWLWYTPPTVELDSVERRKRAEFAVIAGGIPGRHKPPRWRTRLAGRLHTWWTSTAPRGVDTRIRHAQVRAKDHNAVAVRWRQSAPRTWVPELVAAHEVDIAPSPQTRLRRLADDWQDRVPDETAGTFFTDDTALQGAAP